MGRPRSIDDERLLAAAGAVIARDGPNFTLSSVAEHAGVSVGSVAGRFGSKHGLLVALTEAGTRQAVAVLREAADAAGGTARGVRDALLAVFRGMDDPETAGNHVAQLGVDITDPELRRLLAAHYAALESELAGLIRETDRWAGPDPATAARVLVAAANGVAFDWSIRPRGRLRDRLADDLEHGMGLWWR